MLAATLYQGNNEIAEMLVKSRYATTINDEHKPATKAISYVSRYLINIKTSIELNTNMALESRDIVYLYGYLEINHLYQSN